MALALKRIKVYLKLAAIVAVVAIMLILVVKNREHTARIWFFWFVEDVNVLWLILITAISAIVLWWGFTKVFGILRELREVQRLGEAEKQLDEQRRLAQELAEREKRIDEKVTRSIREENREDNRLEP